jgi:hypothetical protein
VLPAFLLLGVYLAVFLPGEAQTVADSQSKTDQSDEGVEDLSEEVVATLAVQEQPTAVVVHSRKSYY